MPDHLKPDHEPREAPSTADDPAYETAGPDDGRTKGDPEEPSETPPSSR